MSNKRIFWTAALVIVALDVATKLIVQNTLNYLEPRPIIGDFARFTLV